MGETVLDAETLIVAAYGAGLTGAEIAAARGTSARAVMRVLDERRVSRRRVGPRGRTDVPTAEIVRLRDDEGMTWPEVAAAVEMSRSGVQRRYFLHHLGYDINRGRAAAAAAATD